MIPSVARTFFLVLLFVAAAAIPAPAQDNYIYTIRPGVRELFLDDIRLGAV